MNHKVIIETVALAMLLTLSFTPFVAGNASSSGCPVTWIMPSGTYSHGSTESALVTTACGGVVSWNLMDESTSLVVGSGTVTCPSTGCSASALFSKVLQPGSYQAVAEFNGASYAFSFVVSDFLVTPQFPIGAVLAVITPIAALIGYSKIRTRKLRV
jgi:hypothetical protein